MSDFIAAYGWGAFHAPAVWPTGDGIVPIGILHAWTDHAGRRTMLRLLRDVTAVQLGNAGFHVTKDGERAVRRALRRVRVAAGLVRDEGR